MARLLTLLEASDRLGISAEAVQSHIRAGRLRAANLGNGERRPRWRISEEALEDFVAARTAAPRPAARKRRAATTATEFF